MSVARMIEATRALMKNAGAIARERRARRMRARGSSSHPGAGIMYVLRRLGVLVGVAGSKLVCSCYVVVGMTGR